MTKKQLIDKASEHYREASEWRERALSHYWNAHMWRMTTVGIKAVMMHASKRMPTSPEGFVLRQDLALAHDLIIIENENAAQCMKISQMSQLSGAACYGEAEGIELEGEIHDLGVDYELYE